MNKRLVRDYVIIDLRDKKVISLIRAVDDVDAMLAFVDIHKPASIDHLLAIPKSAVHSLKIETNASETSVTLQVIQRVNENRERQPDRYIITKVGTCEKPESFELGQFQQALQAFINRL